MHAIEMPIGAARAGKLPPRGDAPMLAEVPATLLPYWAGTAHHDFPGIPRDASFYAQSLEGLMMFFDCVAAAGTICALPSLAAGSVWHAWTCLDEPGLHRFCLRHVGRTIPHGAGARLLADMDRALATCLVAARRRASMPAAGACLPPLFSLDCRLGMPQGYGYRIINGQVACSPLDEFGNTEDRLSFPSVLAPEGLLLAGLVSQAEYQEAARPDSAAGSANNRPAAWRDFL